MEKQDIKSSYKISRKKISYFFNVILFIALFIFLFNFVWIRSLYVIGTSLSLRNTFNIINFPLLTSCGLFLFAAKLIDRSFFSSIGDKKENVLQIKNLSKIQKIGVILVFLGCLVFGISIFLGEILLLTLGVNVFTNIFIILLFVGIGLGAIGTILIIIARYN